MRTDPEPDDPISNVDAERSVVQARADGPVFLDFLQLQRWVPRVRFQQHERFVRR